MLKKTDKALCRYKRIFITTMPVVLILSLYALLSSAEQKKEAKAELKYSVYNLYNREMGRISAREGIISNTYGAVLGSVQKDGTILNSHKIVMGRVDEDGSVFNQAGTRVGYVNEQGEIFTISNRKIGYVKEIPDKKLTGGAARLIFFKVKSWQKD